MSEDRRAWDPIGGKDNSDVHPNVQVLLSDSELFFRYYMEDCKALVFVVDSSDRTRMPEAQKSLKKILGEEKLTNVPLMVLANKKDLPNSMTIREVNLKMLNLKLTSVSRWEEMPKCLCLEQISHELGLATYTDRVWEIQACSGLKGLGLRQAFNSINKMIKRSWHLHGLQAPGGEASQELRMGGFCRWGRALKRVCILNSLQHVQCLFVFGYNKPFETFMSHKMVIMGAQFTGTFRIEKNWFSASFLKAKMSSKED